MIKREPSKDFVNLVNDATKHAKVRKSKIAVEIGMHQSTLTRIFRGELGVNKPTATAIVKAINRLAGHTVIDETEALQIAGFQREEKEFLVFNLGDGAQLQLEDKFSDLEQKEIVEILQIGFEIAVGKIELAGTKKGT